MACTSHRTDDIATGGIPPTVAASGDQQLSSDELAVCTAMGITPEQYRKTSTAPAAAARTAGASAGLSTGAAA